MFIYCLKHNVSIYRVFLIQVLENSTEKQKMQSLHGVPFKIELISTSGSIIFHDFLHSYFIIFRVTRIIYTYVPRAFSRQKTRTKPGRFQ